MSNENQKPNSDAYRFGWNVIFKKDILPIEHYSHTMLHGMNTVYCVHCGKRPGDDLSEPCFSLPK